MFRKIAPLALGLLTALFIFVALRPQPEIPLVVAARNLPVGHTLTADDLTLRHSPLNSVPSGALTQTAAALGQTLAVPRTAGDWLNPAHFGAPLPALASDERALAVRVTDATGLAGLLQPGQRVGVAAVLLDRLGNDTYAKATIGGLRVMYVPPTFRAATEAAASPTTNALLGAGSSASQPRREAGVIVLAVPVRPQAILYQPLTSTVSPESFQQWVSPVELLAALNASPDAVLSLYLEPEKPAPLPTSGLNLADLLTPALVMPTPDNRGGVK